MNKFKAVLFWTPRIATILFIAFVSLFALDVFGQGYTLGETLVGLFMHLTPSFVLALVLFIAWKRELLGGLIFLLLGFLFFFLTNGNFIARLPIGAPLFLIGSFFLAQYFYKKN